MRVIDRLRNDFLERAEELAERSAGWNRKQTESLSDKAKEIKEFLDQNVDESERENLAGLCSIIIGEKIPVTNENAEYEPGLFLVDVDGDVLFTCGGLVDSEGNIMEGDSSLNKDDEPYYDIDFVRAAKADEIREFLKDAGKELLLDLDEVLNKGDEK